MATVDQDIALKLKEETTAVRVMKAKWGVRRTLTKGQLQKAASAFDAEADVISGSKKLIDTRTEKWQAVIGVLNRVSQYFKSVTVPYPEKSIRLLRRSKVDGFNDQMVTFRAELDQATAALQDHFNDMRIAAETKLGDLFESSDYPEDVASLFKIDWDYPSITPPDYLKDLNPELYEQQKARVMAKFDEAIALTEQAFAEELQKLVELLFERMTPKQVTEWNCTASPTNVEESITDVRSKLEHESSLLEENGGDTELIAQLTDELQDLETLLSLTHGEDIESHLTEVTWKALTEDGDKKTVRRRKFDFVETMREWLAANKCEEGITKQVQKTFRDNAVNSMDDFFSKFKDLNIGSNEQLDELVGQCQQLVHGVTPSALRNDNVLRQTLQLGLGELKENIDNLLINKPKRAIDLED